MAQFGNTRTLPPRNISVFIRLTDPDYVRDERIAVEYDFSDLGGRIFTGPWRTRGIYTPEEE
jgi:hypothetical protein